MLLRVFRLLTLLLVGGPIVMAAAVLDAPSSIERRAAIGATTTSDEPPQLTRLGHETDDLRDAIAGPSLRFGLARRMLAVFASPQTDRIQARREPPPDKPPRAIG